jgi:hypothetical protein
VRNLDPAFKAQLTQSVFAPVLFVMLTFRSSVQYLCSTPFNITWNGQVFKGLGTLGGISATQEGTEVQADGISLTLSGLDPVIASECESDIQPLAPAQCWLGCMSQGQLVGTPYLFFSGVVDTPILTVTPQTLSITLKLENRMLLLNRASSRRYTSADQHASGYADDTAFSWVESLNDISLKWGEA